jgi:hypothetical protein
MTAKRTSMASFARAARDLLRGPGGRQIGVADPIGRFAALRAGQHGSSIDGVVSGRVAGGCDADQHGIVTRPWGSWIQSLPRGGRRVSVDAPARWPAHAAIGKTLVNSGIRVSSARRSALLRPNTDARQRSVLEVERLGRRAG